MYLFLSQKVHVSKILFHPKISPINMAMHPLFAVPASRTTEARTRGQGEDATIGGLHHQPPAILPLPLLQRGRWRVVLYFLFSPTFTFVSWPNFNAIFHNWHYSPVVKMLDLSLRSLPKSHGSNPGQDKILEKLIFLSVGGSVGTKVVWIDLFIH